MKVLITGANGQLGKALQETAPANYEIVALGRAELDLSHTAQIASTVANQKPDLIINAAAYTAVDKAESEPEAALRLNRDAPEALAMAAREIGIQMVHVSTDFVFDGSQSVPYAPTDPTSPLGVYGETKLAGELAVQQVLPDALILRTAWVYGAHGGNFMRTMLRLMTEREEIRVVADQIGTPTHALGLARAIWTLHAAQAKGIHHWTDAGACSWYDFAVAIQEEALAIGLLTRQIPVHAITAADYPTPAKRPHFSVLDKASSWAITGQAAHWRQELRIALARYKSALGETI